MTFTKLQRQRMWNLMRHRNVFTAEDLAEFGSRGETYLSHLIKARYASSIAPGYPDLLKLDTPTGPLAPDFRLGPVNDPNLASGTADAEQRTWAALRMTKQISLHELQTILGIKSRNKISEYCAQLLDTNLLVLVDPPAAAHQARHYYRLLKDLGPISPIPVLDGDPAIVGVWDCNQSPEVRYAYKHL